MEGFLKEVQRVWDAEWDRVYGASKRGERMRSHHPKVQLVEYTGGKVALLLSSVGMSCFAALAAVAWCGMLAVAVLPAGVAAGAHAASSAAAKSASAAAAAAKGAVSSPGAA